MGSNIIRKLNSFSDFAENELARLQNITIRYVNRIINGLDSSLIKQINDTSLWNDFLNDLRQRYIIGGRLKVLFIKGRNQWS